MYQSISETIINIITKVIHTFTSRIIFKEVQTKYFNEYLNKKV